MKQITQFFLVGECPSLIKIIYSIDKNILFIESKLFLLDQNFISE